MINYKDFAKEKDFALNVRKLLAYCKENGENGIIFPKDVYNISGALAEERYLYISNHDNGLRGIIFIIEDMKDFTLDFSGSELVIDDSSLPFFVVNSENITIKNVAVRTETPVSSYGYVTDCSENGFTFRITGGNPMMLRGGALTTRTKNDRMIYYNRLNAWDKDTGYMTPEFPDLAVFGVPFCKIATEDGVDSFHTDSRHYYNSGLKTGDKISLDTGSRESAGIFIAYSENIKIEGFTRYNGAGMGVIAQVSKNIEISDMTIKPYGDSCFSICADATHFVHCSGLIHIHDSYFEGQLDDALNVHGIYLRIIDKDEDTLLLKFMHCQAQGIDFIKEGSVLETCNSDSLIPKKQYKVKSVEKLNAGHLRVTLEGNTDEISVGDNVTEVSEYPEVIFENCTLKNNRARGMLLASSGKTIIRNNLFDNPGAPIKFESDGTHWFEAGGVKDVLITGNTFKNCMYVKNSWGSTALIDVMRRPKMEEGKYFHKKIEVSGNTFINCHRPIASVNNTEEFIFRNNRLENCSGNDNIIDRVEKYITE